MSSLQKKETLLIVDDSKFQRVVIRQSLGEHFNFAEAVSGEECLTIMEKESDAIDLVLLDPPFHYNTLNEVLPALADKVAPGGVVLAESEREAALPERAGALVLAKQYYYGKIMVSRYEKEEQA